MLCQMLYGSLSAVSKPMFASNYAFWSMFKALQSLRTYAALQTQIVNKKAVKNSRFKFGIISADAAVRTRDVHKAFTSI